MTKIQHYDKFSALELNGEEIAHKRQYQKVFLKEKGRTEKTRNTKRKDN
jgi:hypothetical protein